MMRSISPIPSFTSADLDPSLHAEPQGPATCRKATEDIIEALEAIASSSSHSGASTTASASSFNDLSHAPHDQPRQSMSTHLLGDVGHAHYVEAQLAWGQTTPSDPARQPELHPLRLLPASDPSLKQLWGDLSPVSVIPPGPLWEKQVEPASQSSVRKVIRKFKPRRSSPPVPSRFCHICARTQKSIKVYCANLKTSKKCRKAVCQICFNELKWDFESARDGGTWLCPHCQGICASVPRARCHIYTKTNEKRKVDKTMKR